MLLAIFGGLFIGSWLDRQFGTGNKLTVLFLLIGVAAGMRNIYVLIKRNFPNEEDGPKRCIKNEPHRKRPPPKKA
jgi:ATP synthase protein I